MSAETKYNLLEVLSHLTPASLSYDEWIDVGQALKAEGYTAEDWEDWSSADARHKPGECYKKWDTFHKDGVTGGTVVEYARRYGTFPQKQEGRGKALSWNSVIHDKPVVDVTWVDDKPIHEPVTWNPASQVIQYLDALFEPDEYVGYVTETYETEDGYKPTKGTYAYTQAQLISRLEKHNDIGKALGDYHQECGAWIRFNPLDGKGVDDQNVTSYRYALVEADEGDLAKQNAILHELQLPIACLVYSGGKSVHAIVKVEAPNRTEYRNRVDFLYKICEKNGLKVDRQNKNPARLSRMPGVLRDYKDGKTHKQFIMDVNIGCDGWDEWIEYMEDVNDDLPDVESLADVWDNPPPLAPVLIDGILRQGHKMLISGPSKAGKSFALIELAIAIAEGKKWLGFQCRQGRVLYVNLEIDEPSFVHRFLNVYKSSKIKADNVSNIDMWTLRGKAVGMDKLAPKIIRRAKDKGYALVIVDPIYKVITGDENNASDMGSFCNEFDKVCNELGCSIAYVHHFTKGPQGNRKSMDRASGSGVFARDPDAIVTITDLAKESKHESYLIQEVLKVEPGLRTKEGETLKQAVYRVAKSVSPWRVEFTLREFPTPPPINLWYWYPLHRIDEEGILDDAKILGTPEKRSQKEGQQAGAYTNRSDYEERVEELEDTFDKVQEDGQMTIQEMAEYLSVSPKTVKRMVDSSEELVRENGKIYYANLPF